MIQEFLFEKLGRSWAAVMTPSEANLLDLNLENWGGRPERMLAHMPWERAAGANADIAQYVERDSYRSSAIGTIGHLESIHAAV